MSLSSFCLDGIGELQYYTGDVYRGSWKDGLRHGKVIGAYICNCFAGILCNLSVLYTVAIVYLTCCCYDLQGKIMYYNNDVFEGVFHSGHIEGKGKLVCQHNGVQFSGEFKNSLVSMFSSIAGFDNRWKQNYTD